MIASCTRAACHTMTDIPDGQWLALRPLVWTAFTEELIYCSVACMVVDQTEKHQPPCATSSANAAHAWSTAASTRCVGG